MIVAKKTPFEQVISYLGSIRTQFSGIPRHVTDSVREIRLRAGYPVTLECSERRLKLTEPITAEQINECVREFCGYSVHSYEKQFKEGWLTLEGGHRAGFTGTAVLRNGIVENLHHISSVNLRIARQYIGCADDLYSKVNCSEPFMGLLIIGRPLSAKTTVLRDLCRLISNDYKVALIDERSEIAATQTQGEKSGIPALDVGENTDILNNFPKSTGIMTALRSLSPEYVVCDEIGWETEELAALANSGIKMIITAHSGGLQEMYSSVRIRSLLESGGISHIALLGHGKNIGKLEYYGKITHSENSSVFDGNSYGDRSGSLFFIPIENA